MSVATPVFQSDHSLTMRVIAAHVKGNVPPMIWGDPGQAKSAKIAAAAEKSGYLVGVIIGSIREATDYLGLPVEQEIEIEGVMVNGVVYTPPMWAVMANKAKKAMLIFDELTTSAPSTMKAMLRVLQERFAGDLKLADHVRIICIGNPPETGVDAMDLPAAIANRMGHVEWEFDADEWLNHVTTDFVHTNATPIEDMVTGGSDADKARVGGWVTGYLRTQLNDIKPPVPTDPIKAGRAWASPRSWTNVISVLSQVDARDEDAQKLIVTGLVGKDMATKFFAWLAVSDLADPETVLNDPHCVDWSAERADRVFAMMSSVESLVSFRKDAKTWAKAMEVMCVVAEQGKPDVIMPVAANLMSRLRPDGTKFDRDRILSTGLGDVLARTERGLVAA